MNIVGSALAIARLFVAGDGFSRMLRGDLSYRVKSRAKNPLARSIVSPYSDMSMSALATLAARHSLVRSFIHPSVRPLASSTRICHASFIATLRARAGEIAVPLARTCSR